MAKTAMKIVYDKILSQHNAGIYEIQTVDILTILQEKGMPQERQQIEEAYDEGWYCGYDKYFSESSDYYTKKYTNEK